MFVLTNHLTAEATKGPESLSIVKKGLPLSLGISRSRPEQQHVELELES